MDTKLTDRDQAVSPAGLPFAVTGREELLQRVLIRLSVPRGRFLPDPELGSRLYRMPRGTEEQMESYARFAIGEALFGLDWAELTDLQVRAEPGGERVYLDCAFRLDGEEKSLTLAV